MQARSHSFVHMNLLASLAYIHFLDPYLDLDNGCRNNCQSRDKTNFRIYVEGFEFITFISFYLYATIASYINMYPLIQPNLFLLLCMEISLLPC